MRKILLRLFTVILYLIILLGLFKFKLHILFNIKMILLVVFGTGLLTLTNYRKGRTFEELRESAGWNAMLTAYLTTFVMVFFQLSGPTNQVNLLYNVAMNCRPLLYGLILNILLKGDYEKRRMDEKQDIEQGDNDSYNTEMEEAEEKIIFNVEPLSQDKQRLCLRNQGLTDREIEIAMDICNGLTNREIAGKLFITESTVKKHTTNFYKKIDVSNREQLKQYMKNQKGLNKLR